MSNQKTQIVENYFNMFKKSIEEKPSLIQFSDGEKTEFLNKIFANIYGGRLPYFTTYSYEITKLATFDTIGVHNMPRNFMGHCENVFIVNQNGNIRIFALEFSYSNVYMLCEYSKQRHLNYGVVENSEDAVKTRLAEILND